MTNETPTDIRLSFDQVPHRYDRVRPRYPARFFDLLFAALADPASVRSDQPPRLLEVGPGTGQATGDLLARGADVIAVEIGPSMAAFLRHKFIGEQRLRVHNRAFETIGPDEGPFDGVVSFCAYHWIDATERTVQPHRLLRAGGLLAVVSLIHVGDAADRGYFDRVQPIYEAFGDGRHDWTPPTHAIATPDIADELERSPLFHDVELHRQVWDQTYSAAEYRDLLLTYSGIRMMPPTERERLVDQLVAVVVDEYDGVLTRPLSCTLTMARAMPVSRESSRTGAAVRNRAP